METTIHCNSSGNYDILNGHEAFLKWGQNLFDLVFEIKQYYCKLLPTLITLLSVPVLLNDLVWNFSKNLYYTNSKDIKNEVIKEIF